MSLIVLSYMQRHYLDECLNSIFMQDYPSIELVVCDDCSADFNPVEVERYILKNKPDNIQNVVVFRQPRNVGIVQNAQKGVELSSGIYFKLHAADDMLLDESVLTEMVELMEDTRSGAVSARSVACMDDGSSTEHYYPWNLGIRRSLQHADAHEQRMILSTMPVGECYHPTALFWRREAFDTIGGFDRNYHYIEDLPMLLNMTGTGREIQFTERVTTIYRYGGTLSRGYSGVHREFYSAYYTEMGKMLRELALPYVSGSLKKRIRCRYLIQNIEFRANTLPDWENLSWMRQLIWRIQHFGFLVLFWLYHKRTVGIHAERRSPLMIMAASLLMFFFHVEIWPGKQIDRVWAILFFAAALWLLLGIIAEASVKLINRILNH